MSFKNLVIFIFCIAANSTYAAKCPPQSVIESVIFNKAILYDQQLDIWELLSFPFDYNGMTWEVSYGLYLHDIVSPEQAVQRGQLQFKQDKVIHSNPPVDTFPGHLFCDYTDSRVEYWIQAMSSPGA